MTDKIFNYRGVIEKLRKELAHQKEINVKLTLNMIMIRNEDDRIIALRDAEIISLKENCYGHCKDLIHKLETENKQLRELKK